MLLKNWPYVTIYIYLTIYIYIYIYVVLMSRESANGSGYWGSIPGRVIPKTQKMVLDASLFCTQHYMVRVS